MNQIELIDNSLQRVFDKVDDIDQIVKFMLWYFQEYAYANHLELDFATCLKEVNENLSNQAKNAVSRAEVLENKTRAKNWIEAHDKFEEHIRLNLVSIAKKFKANELLFDLNPEKLWIGNDS